MASIKTHADQYLIEGLLQNNSAVIQTIYKNFAPKVIHYIKINNGDVDHAQDVIQEVLMVIYNQAKTKDLRLTCPFEAYFFLLCKRKWLNELKKSSHKQVTIQDNILSIDESVTQMVLMTEDFDERQALFDQMFQKLGEKCRELLKLSFVAKTLDEVADKLNVSYAYVRKKKSLCTGQLTELIQQSSQYKSLKH